MLLLSKKRLANFNHRESQTFKIVNKKTTNNIIKDCQNPLILSIVLLSINFFYASFTPSVMRIRRVN